MNYLEGKKIRIYCIVFGTFAQYCIIFKVEDAGKELKSD